jgi:hypothetical protein
MQNTENLMIKKLFYLVITGLLVPIILYGQAKISVKVDIPEKVEAGKEFNVNVVIQKGKLEEFSRFQQEIPAGLTASAVNSGTADFSFDKQRLRFIWLKLPAQEEINISYKVMVNERLKGEFTIQGEFSYVENDERKSVELKSGPVIIQPSPTVDPNLQVDISQYDKVISAEKTSQEALYDISCIRQTPFKTTTGNELIVRLLVYKKGMNKFAKIEEQIPAGYEAKSMETKEGIFTFKDGLVKFVWMNLPAESGFVVSYRLVPSSNKSPGNVSIKGQLSYIDEGRNIVVDIVQKDVDLANVNEQNVEQFLSSIGSAKTVTALTETTSETKQEPTPIKEVTITGKDETKKTEEQPGKSTEEKKVTPVTESSPLPKEPDRRYSDIPPTQSVPVEAGIYYRIQLAATHRIIDPVSNFKRYNLDKPVLLEYHNGWYKYSIGSFAKYSDANNYKEMIVTRKKISGAFIVAYQNGQRIEVKDALRMGGKN